MSSKLKKHTIAFLLIIGSIFTLIGTYSTVDSSGFLSRSLTATAVVIYNNPSQMYGGTNYFPTFQFVNSKTGENVTAIGVVGHGPGPAYSVGQEVQVLYDPENPEVGVKANSFVDVWLMSVIGLTVGIVMLTIAAIKIRGSKKGTGSQAIFQEDMSSRNILNRL